MQQYISISIVFLLTLFCSEDTFAHQNKRSKHEKNTLEARFFTTILPEHAHDDKQILVLDAGHGGHDPGCQGKHSKEKDIALKIALQLRDHLKATRPDIRVYMTREQDIFLPLHERIAIANRKKADLFISIHCNYAGNPHVCGTETFVMGLHRAEDNLNVAKRENEAVLLEDDFDKNYDGYDPNSPLGHILLSTFQNIFLNESIQLADHVEKAFIGHQRKSRGVKQAGFVVLREATMPSILIESGFLSNAKEEKYLISNSGQAEIARGIGSAVTAYFPSIISKKNAKPASRPTNKIQGFYSIQVGAYSKKNDRLHKEIQEVNSIVEVEQKGSIYKYYLGKYTRKDEASKDVIQLKKMGYSDVFIVRRD